LWKLQKVLRVGLPKKGATMPENYSKNDDLPKKTPKRLSKERKKSTQTAEKGKKGSRLKGGDQAHNL